MGISVWSLVWRDTESQMNPFTNPFHFLFFPVGTEPKLRGPSPAGQGYEESCITKDIKKQSLLSPLRCPRQTCNYKICMALMSSFRLPIGSPVFPGPLQAHTPIIARCTRVIISPNPWWRPVFFDSCQIPLIMSSQLAHSRTHLGVGSLLSTTPS